MKQRRTGTLDQPPLTVCEPGLTLRPRVSSISTRTPSMMESIVHRHFYPRSTNPRAFPQAQSDCSILIPSFQPFFSVARCSTLDLVHWVLPIWKKTKLAEPHGIPLGPAGLEGLPELGTGTAQQLLSSCHVLGGGLGPLLDEPGVLLNDAFNRVAKRPLASAGVGVHGLASSLPDGLQGCSY